ncbi:MAG: hypothetical protein ACNA8W_11220 [Bradymonadaceae bacterium]
MKTSLIIPLFLLGLGLTLLIGCSSSDDGQSPDEDETLAHLAEFHQALHETACEAVWQCEHRWTRNFSPNAAELFWAYWFGLEDSEESCKARHGTLGQKPFFGLEWMAVSVGNQRVSFDVDATEACLEDLYAGICDGTHRHARLTSACRAVLAPRVGPGGGCDHDMECGGGSTCDTGPDPFCGGLCDGGPLACGCALEEYCLQDRCFRYLEPGEACEPTDRCVPTAGCEPGEGVCVPYHTLDEGASCATSDYCKAELACVDGTCSPIDFVGLDEECNGREILCRIGAICLRDGNGEQRCEGAPTSADVCDEDDELPCRPGLRCYHGVCTELLAPESACQTDTDCLSRFCHQGLCAAACTDIL